MILTEQQIIDSVQRSGTMECLLANNTKLEQRVASAFFKQWSKWIDASAHDAPPPDYYSGKLRMMFDVLTVFDSEIELEKKPGKFRNPILEEERNGEREGRAYLQSMGIDASDMNVFYDCESDGLEYDVIHTYENYQTTAVRVIKKHIDKLPLYQSNHPGYTCGLLIHDCTEAYIEVSSIMDIGHDGKISIKQLHYPWLDKSFITPMLNTDLRFLIWSMPYKKYSSKPGCIDYPVSVILDLKYPKLKSQLRNYMTYLMRAL